MRAKSLDDRFGTQDWATVVGRLDEGVLQAPDTGGPNRHTCWLTTINPDGSPHVTPVGGVWVDGAFWFQTGDRTRKAKNVARDPRCTMSVATDEFDLVVNGSAEKVADSVQVSRVVAVWVAGGWPCEVDASGVGLTAPFNAPSTGPPPWFVYRITPRSATSVSTVEPGGVTRWTW
jgi:hypothetical protein